MTTETQYICDMTGDKIKEEDAVPVTVKKIKSTSGHKNPTRDIEIKEVNTSHTADHVSEDLLKEQDLQINKYDFEELVIIVLGDRVVGWRDRNPYLSCQPRSVDDKQRAFLRELTHL